MNKVVKCRKCGQHFMHTEKNTKCPFCHTEYGDVEGKLKDLSAQTRKNGTTKTQKESFKIWRDS